jgi:hypothetical protein
MTDMLIMYQKSCKEQMGIEKWRNERNGGVLYHWMLMGVADVIVGGKRNARPPCLDVRDGKRVGMVLRLGEMIDGQKIH